MPPAFIRTRASEPSAFIRDPASIGTLASSPWRLLGFRVITEYREYRMLMFVPLSSSTKIDSGLKLTH